MSAPRKYLQGYAGMPFQHSNRKARGAQEGIVERIDDEGRDGDLCYEADGAALRVVICSVVEAVQGSGVMVVELFQRTDAGEGSGVQFRHDGGFDGNLSFQAPEEPLGVNPVRGLRYLFTTGLKIERYGEHHGPLYFAPVLFAQVF